MNWQETASPRASTTSLSSMPEKRINTRVATIGAAIVLAVILGGFYAYTVIRSNAQQANLAANRRPATEVSVEAVTPASVSPIIDSVGSLTAEQQVTVSSEVSGQITALNFRGGETVNKGDLLVQLNDASERADLLSFQAQQRQAELALNRGTELQKRGNMADAQYDQLHAQFDVAKSNVARTAALIEKKKIRAPFAGSLGVRDVELGQYLAPGQAIVSLTDLSALNLNITVPEQDRPKLSVGQAVNLTVDAYPGRTFSGTISVIDPQISADARTVRVQATVANEDRALSPGMFARARIVLPPVPDVLTLSETSIGSSLYGDYVFRVVSENKDGKERLITKRVQIKTAERFNGRVAITEGLSAGDRVVSVGLNKVNDGGEISISNAAKATP
jgi:multidrug efflux system membrane fusion protein